MAASWPPRRSQHRTPAPARVGQSCRAGAWRGRSRGVATLQRRRPTCRAAGGGTSPTRAPTPMPTPCASGSRGVRPRRQSLCMNVHAPIMHQSTKRGWCSDTRRGVHSEVFNCSFSQENSQERCSDSVQTVPGQYTTSVADISYLQIPVVDIGSADICGYPRIAYYPSPS